MTTLQRKKVFKYGSETAARVFKKMIESDAPLDIIWKEYRMTSTIDSSISKTYRLFVKGSRIAIIQQLEDHVQKVTIFVGERPDENKNPNKRIKEYLNTLLATFAEFSDLPQVRLMREPESGVTFVAGVAEGSPRGPFCKDYCSKCVIKTHSYSPHGFELNFG